MIHQSAEGWRSSSLFKFIIITRLLELSNNRRPPRHPPQTWPNVPFLSTANGHPRPSCSNQSQSSSSCPTKDFSWANWSLHGFDAVNLISLSSQKRGWGSWIPSVTSPRISLVKNKRILIITNFALSTYRKVSDFKSPCKYTPHTPHRSTFITPPPPKFWGTKRF